MSETPDQKIRLRNAVARAHSQSISGQSTSLLVNEPPAYSGRARELLPIVLANIFLTFVTVGIYRFWAKTRLRHYFVSRISFLGDPLEYRGTGLELFIGFLIVLGILVPLLIGITILQVFLTRPGSLAVTEGVFQAVYLTGFYYLFHVAVYRAQRYRLSRISWRGIRGGQEGSAFVFAAIAIGMLVVTLVTLGLAHPVARRAVVNYRLNNLRFGTAPLSSDGPLLPLFRIWLVPWTFMLVTVLPILLTLALDGPGAIVDLNAEKPAFHPENIRYAPLILVSFVGWIIAAWWYRAREFRYFAEYAAFGALRFESRLNIFHLLLPNVVYLLSMAVIVIVIAGLGFYFSASAAAMARDVGIGLIVFAVAVGWVLLSALHPIVVQNWILGNLCKTLTIRGQFSPDQLFQTQLEIPRSGEGLADALAVDAF